MYTNPMHLVFTDIEKSGHVVYICNTIEEAKIVMNKIWELGNPPSPFSLEELVEIFNHLNFKCYQLDEDHLFYPKALINQSNGFYTVGIVELNDDFTLDDYLKSRNPS